jgi:hypothetical protein
MLDMAMQQMMQPQQIPADPMGGMQGMPEQMPQGMPQQPML